MIQRGFMKKLVSLPVLSLTLIYCFALFAPRNLAAQSGSYGFLINQSHTDATGQNGTALLGVMNFDGTGNVSGPYTLKAGAKDTRPAQTGSGTFTGTYSGKPDGTGSVTMALDLGITLTFALVIDDGGRSLHLVATTCLFGSEGCNLFGSVFSGIARAGQAGSLNGSFGFQITNSPVPSTTIGVAAFDGSGNATVSFTAVGPGRDDTGPLPVFSGTITGTYSINSDGSGTLNFPASDQSQGSTYAFVLTEGGSGLLFLQTDSTGPNVSFGTARLQ
jgi:hypothetical protein